MDPYRAPVENSDRELPNQRARSNQNKTNPNNKIQRAGQAAETAGRVGQVASKGAKVGGEVAQAAGKGMEAGGQAMDKGGQVAMKAGQGMTRAWLAMSGTGAGAVVGLPLAAAGMLTTGAGAVASGTGKASRLAGRGAQKAGQAAKKVGEKGEQASNQLKQRGGKLKQLANKAKPKKSRLTKLYGVILIVVAALFDLIILTIGLLNFSGIGFAIVVAIAWVPSLFALFTLNLMFAFKGELTLARAFLFVAPFTSGCVGIPGWTAVTWPLVARIIGAKTIGKVLPGATGQMASKALTGKLKI